MNSFKLIEFDASALLRGYVIRDAKRIIRRSFKKGQWFDVDLAVNAVYGFGDEYRRHYTRTKLANICQEAIEQMLNNGEIKQDCTINSSKPTYYIERTQEFDTQKDNQR